MEEEDNEDKEDDYDYYGDDEDQNILLFSYSTSYIFFVGILMPCFCKVHEIIKFSFIFNFITISCKIYVRSYLWSHSFFVNENLSFWIQTATMVAVKQ